MRTPHVLVGGTHRIGGATKHSLDHRPTSPQRVVASSQTSREEATRKGPSTHIYIHPHNNHVVSDSPSTAGSGSGSGSITATTSAATATTTASDTGATTLPAPQLIGGGRGGGGCCIRGSGSVGIDDFLGGQATSATTTINVAAAVQNSSLVVNVQQAHNIVVIPYAPFDVSATAGRQTSQKDPLRKCHRPSISFSSNGVASRTGGPNFGVAPINDFTCGVGSDT